MITKDQARGDSQGLTRAEYERHASRGAERVSSILYGIPGADDAWKSVQEPWGGVTLAMPSQSAVNPEHGYAVAVSNRYTASINLPIGGSEDTFRAAFREAVIKFAGAPYIGVFRDDSDGEIQIDAVVIVDTEDDAKDIATFTESLGGAYDFSTGNGVWPYHVAD